MSSVIGIQLH